MKRLIILLMGLCMGLNLTANTGNFTSANQTKTTDLQGINLSKATIVYQNGDAPLVKQMAQVLADDIERVSGIRPQVSTRRGKGQNIVIGTVKFTKLHRKLQGTWERYAIDTKGSRSKEPNLYITGSDARGLAYGVLHVSEAIGVSPWYWFADVPIDKSNKAVFNYAENYVSKSPSVKYRGIFINDEDWGMKTWAAQTYEKELGDIGPKTYDRVCELILRLKGNMLAPAMHTCTGAFYSHPESQKMADKWGIMITTSHCEPLLFNNAAPSEWDKQRDGEWNYETNSATILKKLDDRIRETATFDNIYTMGMRGLHDEAMKGSTDPTDRARTLEKVFVEQRNILEKYKHDKASRIPQIFVPYKETLDIYDAGLRVPEDITLVWPDDNYGYMKRVSNEAEQQRSGGSGVYYHLSYCGVPHDNLWISTTAPMLMYEELLKAYTAGADRYWLLNVGDIKPMEVEMQMFMDMAYDFSSFKYDNANTRQAEWLAKVFGDKHQKAFQFILDHYYRLAWDRKPEFMGYEMEWDSPEYSRLYDTDFSFETGTAQKRLVDYQNICFAYDAIENEIDPSLRPALFEMLGYSVHSAYQMNRKFLYAQANHETGNEAYAEQSRDAFNELERLIDRYNTQLDGKWNQMISEVTPGYTALYHQMPQFTDKPTDEFRLPDNQRHQEFRHKIQLSSLNVTAPFRLLDGIGTDWKALQLGQPLDQKAAGSIDIAIPGETLPSNADSINLCISVVPMWPVATDQSNRFSVSVDKGKAVVCENVFKEWGREWKIQVLENRKEFILKLPIDKTISQHIISISIVDPGQIIQSITYQ
ncbi:MAG: glycosyl hydrolase 115 family protein [Prevotella sp.]|nr:glycosyl hydrolase 115 family protein [Prevotella sp.]